MIFYAFIFCSKIVLQFSKTVGFLDECSEKAGLLQATIRNKKVFLFIFIFPFSLINFSLIFLSLIKSYELLLRFGRMSYLNSKEICLVRLECFRCCEHD